MRAEVTVIPGDGGAGGKTLDRTAGFRAMLGDAGTSGAYHYSARADACVHEGTW
jgi:hypothetical protein